jgi:hypothetical protein
MPDLSVSEAQLERLEEIRDELESFYIREYGTVRTTDAVQYLLDTYTPPDVDASGVPGVDLEALTVIDGVGEATAEALVDAGFSTVEHVRDADPESITDLDGVGSKQAVDIVASAAEIVAESSPKADETESSERTESSEDADSDESDSADETPENTLRQAMSLLDSYDEHWREASGDEPYEVDLPDGSTTAVRTKDDIKRLIFKHWK